MKKITSLLINCSLALAGALLAQQQPEAEQSPKKTEKAHAAETKPKANAPNVERTAPETGMKQRGATNKERTNLNAQKTEAAERGRRAATAETNAAQSAPPQAEQRRKGQKVRGENAANARASNSPMTAPEGRATPVTATKQTTNAPTINQANADANKSARKPDAQQVQQIKQQHTNFQAQPRPDRVPAVTFSANHRIEGAEHWQGSQYEVFRAYHPEWHDQAWYRGHYNRVVLIGGGYYYWREGYWYPAWGYDPSAAYYVYDGPIYVGHRAEPPDQVIADVQAELQQMGYYQGEVDGLLGPLTRQALTDYQADHGLVQTAAIDEPTLDSLELG